MTPKEFFETVVEMRKAQNNYFAARKRKEPWEVCNKLQGISKDYEKQIDAEINRVNKLINEPQLNFE